MREDSLFLLLVTLLLAVSVSECAEIVVGGMRGWTTGFDYDAWASSQNFQPRVGDSLVFVNPDSAYHTVSLLDSADAYQRCTLGGTNAVHPVRTGKNFTMTIPASLSGNMLYAVCTISGHCTEGQKISAMVLPSAVVQGTPQSSPRSSPSETSDADMNQYICWTTAILLIVACFWNSG